MCFLAGEGQAPSQEHTPFNFTTTFYSMSTNAVRLNEIPSIVLPLLNSTGNHRRSCKTPQSRYQNLQMNL